MSTQIELELAWRRWTLILAMVLFLATLASPRWWAAMLCMPIFVGAAAVHFFSRDVLARWIRRGTLLLADLAKDEWTVEAHLVVELWNILHYDLPEAEQRIRDGIKSYTVAAGGHNTDSTGYHETITLFYMDAIDDFLDRNVDVVDEGELYERLLASDIATLSPCP